MHENTKIKSGKERPSCEPLERWWALTVAKCLLIALNTCVWKEKPQDELMTDVMAYDGPQEHINVRRHIKLWCRGINTDFISYLS